MHIAFLMDPLASINPENETTSHLMYECNQRGHTVYFLEPHDIYIRENQVVARMRNISVSPNLSMKKYWRCLIQCLKKDELIFETIADLDALFLRKNPPLIYQTMEFLSSVSDKVFMINNTMGQVIANSKLYILNFPEIIPETHVSRDPARLRKIIKNFGGAMVVKPPSALWWGRGDQSEPEGPGKFVFPDQLLCTGLSRIPGAGTHYGPGVFGGSPNKRRCADSSAQWGDCRCHAAKTEQWGLQGPISMRVPGPINMKLRMTIAPSVRRSKGV